MERKEFLSLIGISSASIFAAACLGGCSKSAAGVDYTTAPTNIDINLDLSLPANGALNTTGGYLYTNGIIVAKATTGSFLAVSQACTHQGVTVQYQSANQHFYCPSHGATFSSAGGVISGPVSVGLKQYNTALTGNVLRIYS